MNGRANLMTSPSKQGTDLLYGLIAQARQYSDAVLLGRGDPDPDTPAHIVAAANAAIQAGESLPTRVEGLTELREAIARRVKRVNGIQVNPATEVVVTNGGQSALLLTILSLVGPGDEIIVPVPSYNTYEDAIRFAGAIKVEVPTYVYEDFQVDPDRVRAAVTDRSRCLLMVSPNNPSAGVISPDNVRALVEIAVENNLTIIADEIYDLFLYDGAQHLSPASIAGGRERTLTLNAVSKAYSMTGWRLGWVVGPQHLMARVTSIKAGVTGPTSLISQRAALAALTGPQDCVSEFHEIYKYRRRIVMQAVSEMGFTFGVPKGGQFLFADISSSGMDSVALAQRVLDETHVLIYPGVAFGKDWERFMRITFLQPDEILRDALARVTEVVKAVRQGN